MSVRRRTWTNRTTGVQEETWMVDVKFQHPDGRSERVRKHSPVQTRRGAEQYERELRQALLDGSFGREEAQRTTFAAFATDFVETYAAANNKPSEKASKEWILRLHLVPFFGAKALSAIRAQDVEAYKATKLKEGVSPKTVHNHLACLNRLLAVAVEWGKLDAAPRIKPVKLKKPETDFLDFEEAERLTAHTGGMLRAMVVTALHTGLRIGELRALRRQDVDLGTGKLRVRQNIWRNEIGTPKGGKEREVPLNSVVAGELREHRHLRGQYVFCHDDGGMLGETESYPWLAEACDRAGLRQIGWHTLRHTFASHLVMRGVPLKAVQELLGHASIDMTMRYAHLSPDIRRDAVEVLAKAPEGHIRGTAKAGPENPQ